MSEPKKLPGIASRSVLRLLLALSLMAMAGMASAKPEDITEPEMKLIPSYCADTMGFKYGDAYYNTSPRAGHWIALMGKGFWAMHHYCWARINMNRAQRAGVPAQTRRALWESARGDYGYVVNNTVPDFIMLPEIYTRIGEVELLLAHPDKANLAFIHAREIKPDYWPAYSHWAEFLIGISRRPDALKIVSAGLEHAPESRVLLEQFRVLGGRKSDIPKPKEKPPETPTAATGPVAPEAPEAQAASDAAHDDK